MKQIFILFILAWLVAACQPQATQTAAAAPEPRVVIAQPTITARITQPPVVATDSLTPEMRNMLQQTDLSRLFRAPEAGQTGVLDGFFGNNPQRLSLALLTVKSDSLRPGLFHVTGKTRYKKQVTAFAGTIQLVSVADYYDQGRLLSQGEDSFIQDTTAGGNGDVLNARAYSAAAVFNFTGKMPATYVLSGRAFLDFWMTEKGKVGGLYSPCEGCIDDKAPSKGSVLLLRGEWRDLPDKIGRPFLVCRDVFFISNNLIKDFGIGDRGAQVNPKYSKLGWADYWQNDEWWADSPKPSLNL